MNTMRKLNLLYSFAILGLIFLSSCGEYNKLLKSKDYKMKYEYAQKYYLSEKYSKAQTLFEQVEPLYKGTKTGEEALYMLADCYYKKKDYMMASTYFTKYYTVYPRGQYTEKARFYSGYSLYKNVPDPRLDQTDTYKAMQELQLFREYFPNSAKKEDAERLLFELQDHLAEKALLNTRLYFNLGDYMGNNYQSAILTAQNALKDFPETKFKQEFSIIILRSKMAIAENSIKERQEDRYRDVVDEYYAFVNDYPGSDYEKEAIAIFNKASKKIKVDHKTED